jgi:hypothetical protein
MSPAAVGPHQEGQPPPDHMWFTFTEDAHSHDNLCQKLFHPIWKRIWGRIFNSVRPFYERAVSNLDRSMHRSLWAYVSHSLFIEGSHTTKNTASELTRVMNFSASLADTIGKMEALRAECVEQLWAYLQGPYAFPTITQVWYLRVRLRNNTMLFKLRSCLSSILGGA